MKKIIVASIVGGCIFLGVFCIRQAAKEALPYQQAKVTYDQIREEVAAPAEEAEEPEERKIDFAALQEKNNEIVAWLYVPGTQVDYPICRGEDIDYYLHHNAEKESNILGALFVPPENEGTLNDAHIIIYGHNMRQGQMFGELSNYENEEFFKENPYVYLYTPQQKRTYKIYSVYRCEPSSPTYTVGFLFETKEYRDWQSFSVSQEMYETGTETLLQGESQVLTLSTCADGNRQNRLAVNCVEVKE